ncbi:MAG TPA: hypothetical protein VGK19_12470 [Capsulimonadaceae bacterium]|jgi:phosphoglycerol transferase MdoB-like AlkP superfamily enzyme
MRKRDIEPDEDDLDDFIIPDDDEPDPDDAPLTKQVVLHATWSVVLAATLFMTTVWRSMPGVFGPTPQSSLIALIVIAVIGFPVFVFSATALKVTRPHEGTVVRGLALTAAVLSTLSLLLLANSIGTFIQILRPITR